MLALVAALALGAQPAHMHLLERRLVLAQLAPPPPVMPTDAPPLAEPPPAPFAPPPDAAPMGRAVTPAVPLVAVQNPPPDLHLVDVNKGSFAGGELGVGILGAFGVTLGATIAGVAGLGICAGHCNNDATTASVLVWFLGWYVLEPLVVAGVESWLGRTPRAGSFGKSLGFGYAVEALGLVLAAVLAAASPVASGLLVLAAQWVAVPLVASFGLHMGDGAPGPDDPAPVGLDALPRMGPGR